MTSPPGAPGPGGRQQQRPKPKSGRPAGGTTGRRELARHARFAEISPEVGVLDERAMSQALADDPAAFELLAAMTRATDENLRAAAIRLSASIVLERARAGRPSMSGISRRESISTSFCFFQSGMQLPSGLLKFNVNTHALIRQRLSRSSSSSRQMPSRG